MEWVVVVVQVVVVQVVVVQVGLELPLLVSSSLHFNNTFIQNLSDLPPGFEDEALPYSIGDSPMVSYWKQSIKIASK